jgi:hypothetical protein
MGNSRIKGELCSCAMWSPPNVTKELLTLWISNTLHIVPSYTRSQVLEIYTTWCAKNCSGWSLPPNKVVLIKQRALIIYNCFLQMRDPISKENYAHMIRGPHRIQPRNYVTFWTLSTLYIYCSSLYTVPGSWDLYMQHDVLRAAVVGERQMQAIRKGPLKGTHILYNSLVSLFFTPQFKPPVPPNWMELNWIALISI